MRIAILAAFILSCGIANATQYVSAPSCPNEVKEAAKVGIIEGVACLKKLNTPQSLDHARRILSKTKADSKYKIQCSSKDLGNIMAEAGIGQNWMTIFKSGQASDNDLPNTIFHEMFHSIGYRHHKTIEYAYTCSTCCFEKDDKNLRETACRVCSSSYEGENDLRYMKDLQRFSNAVGAVETTGLISSAFNPLPQWIRQLSLKDRNQVAMANIIGLLSLSREWVPPMIGKSLLDLALKQDNSPVFRILKVRLAEKFQALADPPESRAFVEHFGTAVFSCYAKDFKSLKVSLKYLYANSSSLIEFGFQDAHSLNALYSCSIPGLVKTTNAIGVRFNELRSFLKAELPRLKKRILN